MSKNFFRKIKLRKIILQKNSAQKFGTKKMFFVYYELYGMYNSFKCGNICIKKVL